MTYQQLSLDERYQIQALHRMHLSQAAIARHLKRSPSTISRELQRNSVSDRAEPYVAKRADRLMVGRREAKGAASRKIQGRLAKLVETKLHMSWSPEQISGRLRRENKINVSHETIYQYILRDLRNHGGLRYCLRFAGYKQHRYKRSTMAANTRKRRSRLAGRPNGANQRTELGHWERDCIVSADGGKTALLVHVDRRSLYTRVRHVKKLDVATVSRATREVLAPHRGLTKTLTNDNGHEFQGDAELAKNLGIPIYFCDPGKPWQRGTVENTNGLIRQYFRKRENFDNVQPWLAYAVEETLNFRPRKSLGYRTPHEVMRQERIRFMGGPLLHLGLEFGRLNRKGPSFYRTIGGDRPGASQAPRPGVERPPPGPVPSGRCGHVRYRATSTTASRGRGSASCP